MKAIKKAMKAIKKAMKAMKKAMKAMQRGLWRCREEKGATLPVLNPPMVVVNLSLISG